MLQPKLAMTSIPTANSEKTSTSNTGSHCPICDERVTGTELQVQQHVNRHLDDSEQQLSVALAEHIQLETQSRDPDTHASATVEKIPPPGTSTSYHNTTTTTTTTPAQHMLQQLEISDRALATAMAQEQVTHQHVQPTSTLVPSLSDTAEQYYTNVLHKVLPLFESNDLLFSLTQPLLRPHVHIASRLDLFCSNMAGLGWDCGYRNIQMLFSALLYDRALKSLIQRQGMTEVPSIPEIAGRIEQAWKKGFDPEGASNFDGTLTDKEVWIGATEAIVLFRSININALVTDFETPTETDRKKMFEWIYHHYDGWCANRTCSIHSRQSRVSGVSTLVAPMFCQWQGHSVTIIGAEKSRTGDVSLIVLDPSRGFYESIMTEASNLRPRLFKRDVSHPQMQHPRFQLVYIPSVRQESKSKGWSFGRGKGKGKGKGKEKEKEKERGNRLPNGSSSDHPNQ